MSLLQNWPGVADSPTFAVTLCICINDDILYIICA